MPERAVRILVIHTPFATEIIALFTEVVFDGGYCKICQEAAVFGGWSSALSLEFWV